MKRLSFILITLILLTGASCTSSSSNEASSNSGLTFDVNLSSESAETIVGLGTNEINAGDITLSFSEDSLAQNVSLTTAAIDSLSGSPVDADFIQGLHVFDSGINLLQPATLSFPLPEGESEESLMAFGIEELLDGTKDLYFLPYTIEDDSIKIKVTEFSDYGVLNITKSEVNQYLKVVQPVDKHHQMLQEIAASDEPLEDILKRWFKDEIYPDLQQAETDDLVIMRALRQYVSWLSYIQALGGEDRFPEEKQKAMESIAKSTKYAIEEANKVCVQDKDPLEVNTMIFWLRAAQLFGVDDNHGGDFSDMESKIRGCARFEVTLESSFKSEYSTANSNGSLIIELNEDMTAWTGSGKRTQTIIGLLGSMCEETQTSEYNLNIPWAMVQIKRLPEGQSAVKIEAVIEPDNGEYLPAVYYKCSKPGIDASFMDFDPYLGDLDDAHHQDYVGPESAGLQGYVFSETAYRISGWTYVGTADSFGERLYVGTKNGVTEQTLLRLRHAPISH